MAGIALAQIVLPRIGVRPLVIAGPLLVAGGLLWLRGTSVDGDYVGEVLGGLMLVAFGTAWSFSPLQVAGAHGVAPEQRGLASGLLSVAPQLGGALGIAGVVSVATTTATQERAAGAAATVAQVAGLHDALLIGAIVMVAVAVTMGALIGRLVPTAEDLQPGAVLG